MAHVSHSHYYICFKINEINDPCQNIPLRMKKKACVVSDPADADAERLMRLATSFA